MKFRLYIILSIVIFLVMIGSCTTKPPTKQDDVISDVPIIEEEHFSLAMTQYVLNNSENAINELNKIENLSLGNKAIVDYIKGICLLRIEKYDKAIEYFLYSESYLPIKQELYNNIGVAYYNQGDNKKALEYFHKSYLEDPNFQVAIENYNLIMLDDISDDKILLPFEGEATVYLSYGCFIII